MNKCVICTFIKMGLKGLWTNTCPSIDKKKKEKKAKFGFEDVIALILAFLAALAITAVLMFALRMLYVLVVWLLGAEIVIIILRYLLLSVFGISVILMITVAVTDAIKFVKRTIACIKAYWRKAKEACE